MTDTPAQMRSIPQTPSRRSFIKRCTVATTGLLLLPGWIRAAGAPVWSTGDPFSLGVASGTPSTDGFVLWTRLAPQPLSSDPETPGGVPPGNYVVRYEIATDSNLRTIVRRGEATANSAFAYSVHAEVDGLAPGRPYWYRFSCGDAHSRIGRASTLPGNDASVAQLKLGFVSCANYEHGYFAA
ncbi:MAG: PhoD-like phosphatase N-terminal domain-containing protein, partial [Proteobacteria bacterium]|nr:PhoD-like phosphatase N-terminal domain-containing protein [Pseudomonadota bacterium]